MNQLGYISNAGYLPISKKWGMEAQLLNVIFPFMCFRINEILVNRGVNENMLSDSNSSTSLFKNKYIVLENYEIKSP